MDGESTKGGPTPEITPTTYIEKLYGKSFQATRLENNSLIPVGGGSILSDETDIAVLGDFENLHDIILEMHDTAQQYNLPELKKWLDSQEIEIDERLFATLFAFSKTLEKRFPQFQEAQSKRLSAYSQTKKGEVKLSELFANNTIACAEISALAQFYLQHEGVESKYFSGAALWDRQHEFAEEHSFIVIPHGEQQILFDPTNPTRTTQGLFPSIYTPSANFNQEVRKGQKRFVQTTNMLSKKQVFFGVGDSTNVSEKDIVI